MTKLLLVLAVLALAGWWLSTRRPAAAPMRLAEAYRLLGLTPGASAAEIRAAWRRRMAEAHPDRGGSSGLAARLNAARDCALAALKERQKA